jgi:hypothetical protein
VNQLYRQSLTFNPSSVNSQFNIVIGNGNWTEDVHLVDVGSLQANPDNKGATFQVASNFNCLEFVDHNDSASKGISKYIYDLTQGPAASISASPGTVYRNYFIPHNQDGGKYTGQLKQQINLLDKFPYLTIRNGYIIFSDEEVAYLKSMNLNYEDFSDIQVGIQKKVQVTSGLKRGGKITLCKSEEQIINQVFTAALNLGGLNSKYSKIPEIQKLAKFLLKGAYMATIFSAIENANNQPASFKGRNKLYLTLIGGGVFGNEHSWIAEALYSCIDLIKQSGLQIYLIIYASYTCDEESLQILQCLASEANGTVKMVK